MKKRLIFVAVVLLILINIFPVWGRPHWRYTGSSPDRNVLNLGLPLGHTMVDFNCSPYVFFAPTAQFLFPLEILGVFIYIFLNKKKKIVKSRE